jgi:hypothetical protein
MAKKRAEQDAPAAKGKVSVVAHPRARASIRRWRGRAGLIALLVVSLLSLRAGVPPFDAVLRGLVGGVAAQFLAWAGGVVVWRHLVLAEIAVHRDAQRERLAGQG